MATTSAATIHTANPNDVNVPASSPRSITRAAGTIAPAGPASFTRPATTAGGGGSGGGGAGNGGRNVRGRSTAVVVPAGPPAATGTVGAAPTAEGVVTSMPSRRTKSST